MIFRFCRLPLFAHVLIRHPHPRIQHHAIIGIYQAVARHRCIVDTGKSVDPLQQAAEGLYDLSGHHLLHGGVLEVELLLADFDDVPRLGGGLSPGDGVLQCQEGGAAAEVHGSGGYIVIEVLVVREDEHVLELREGALHSLRKFDPQRALHLPGSLDGLHGLKLFPGVVRDVDPLVLVHVVLVHVVVLLLLRQPEARHLSPAFPWFF